MQLRRKKVAEPFDLWETNNESLKPKHKTHPSLKRTKKIALPHPGQSYNPDPEDHKRLLQKVLEKELAHQKKEEAINKAVRVNVSAKDLRKAEKDELESGIKHLIKDKSTSVTNKKDDDSDSSSTDDEAFEGYNDKDFAAIIKDKTVKEKRKSKQQRLKQLKDKLQRKAAKLKKLKNIRLSKIDAVKKINKELDKKEKEEAKKRKRHKKIKNERLAQRFEPSDPIYCLSSELPTNLRQTSCPMDAIVREQLESFQSRLLVEPSTFQVKKRKYKKRQFDRKLAVEQEG